MNFKRALITGGAGLVGSHIADLLVRDGLDEIVIVDNFTRGPAGTIWRMHWRAEQSRSLKAMSAIVN